jgi:serine/threonine-protein kinase
MEEEPQGVDREFDPLDSYLARLHEGRDPDRAAVLRDFPELASSLDCLEALERLAPKGKGASNPAGSSDNIHDSATLLGKPDSAAGLGKPEGLPATLGEFGDYDLLEEIGRGGMGVVYMARQRSLDRIVAVKMILGSLLASQEQIDRLHLEARVAATVRHPNIVSVFDAGEIHGQHYFAMEYVAGMSLARILEQAALDAKQSARIAALVARAVHHLHERGIVHRDLKPSNILIDPSGRPFVTDFGLAKLFSGDSQLTRTGVIAGTPSYMAPEQAAGGRSAVGPPSDVYSLGAILYEMLTGRPPFKEESPFDTLLQVLEGEPERPRKLNPRAPRELERICLKCLEKAPESRYPTAEAVADDLERFLVDEDFIGPSEGWIRRTWRWARREAALSVRLVSLIAFYVAELISRYLLRVVDDAFHGKVTWLLGSWALISLLLAQLQKRPGWQARAVYMWGVVDALGLLSVLFLASGVANPVVIGYFLIIVASGLGARVRYVWFMTGLSIACYLVLVADYYYFHWIDSRPFDESVDRHVYFVVGLLMTGIGMAYQVERLRRLSRHFDRHTRQAN